MSQANVPSRAPRAASVNLRPLRIIPYLGIAAIVVGPTVWSGQDVGGWLVVGAFLAVGLVLLWRRPREVVAWLVVAAAVVFPVAGNSMPGSASQVVDGHGDAGITLYAWINSWSSSLFFETFVALAALFPTGRFGSGRLGMAGRIAVVVPVAFAILLAFAPEATVAFADGTSASVRLPLAIASDWAGWPIIQTTVYLAVLGALAVAIGTLIVRFRRARGLERQQYKWLLAALAATLGSVVFAFAMILLVDPVGTWMWIPAVVAYPVRSRSRSASPLAGTACTTLTGSSAGRSPGPS